MDDYYYDIKNEIFEIFDECESIVDLCGEYIAIREILEDSLEAKMIEIIKSNNK